MGNCPQLAERFILAALIGAIACEDHNVAAPPARAALPTMSELVTSNVLPFLDSRGRFVVTPELEPGDIAAENAERLAVAWVNDYAKFNKTLLEKDHGGPIDFMQLSPCRTLFAATPYQLVETDAPQHLRNAMASFWLVSLCAKNGEEQLNIGVAATTQATVEDGHVVYHGPYGNDFRVTGVPALVSYPATAESAVAVAVGATSLRAIKPPELIRADRLVYPQASRWKVTLQGIPALAGNETQGQARTAEVFVGFGDRQHPTSLTLEKPNSPSEVAIPVATSGTRGAAPVTRVFHARIRAGRPVTFESATPNASRR